MTCYYEICFGSSDVLKTFPVYEEVEGLQVLPADSASSGAFSGKFPAPRPGGSLVAVAGKGGVVRVFELEGQVNFGGMSPPIRAGTSYINS